jgi:hypothetical protein
MEHQMEQAGFRLVRVHGEKKKPEWDVRVQSWKAYIVTLRNADLVCQVIEVRHLAHSTGCVLSVQCI